MTRDVEQSLPAMSELSPIWEAKRKWLERPLTPPFDPEQPFGSIDRSTNAPCDSREQRSLY
jgi:hypothetical protein